MLNWNDIIHFSVKGNPEPDRRVEKTPAEWRELLSPEQYRITREHGTERPFSGELCSIYEAGKYNCIHLVHYEEFNKPLDAMAREKEIKNWRWGWDCFI